MKNQKFSKKLVLNKKTVAGLQATEMKAAKGGLDPTRVISMCLICPPWWTDIDC